MTLKAWRLWCLDSHRLSLGPCNNLSFNHISFTLLGNSDVYKRSSRSPKALSLPDDSQQRPQTEKALFNHHATRRDPGDLGCKDGDTRIVSQDLCHRHLADPKETKQMAVMYDRSGRFMLSFTVRMGLDRVTANRPKRS